MQQSGHVLESLCVLPPDPRTIFIVPEISNYLHFCFSSVLLLRFLSLSSLSSKFLPVVRVRPSLIPAGCLAACVLLGASLSLSEPPTVFQAGPTAHAPLPAVPRGLPSHFCAGTPLACCRSPFRGVLSPVLVKHFWQSAPQSGTVP